MKVLTGGSGDNFTIEMSGVPTASCIALLLAVGGSSHDQSLFAAAAGGGGGTTVVAATPGTALTGVGTPIATPVSPSDATTACSGAASTTVQFGFGLK